jgi:hypothetical protein
VESETYLPRALTPVKHVTVKVQNDYLARMASVSRPVLALAELIWNGLDADASTVRVELVHNLLGGLGRISVADDGTGISYAEAEHAFESLGGSLKREHPRSKIGKRLVHGKAGKGRFRAFALGSSVNWNTVYREGGKFQGYTIAGSRTNLGSFEITDPAPSELRQTGTVVTINGIDKNFRSLSGQNALQEMTQHLALYLREYAPAFHPTPISSARLNNSLLSLPIAAHAG